MATHDQDQDFPSLLEQISTHWPAVTDQLQFALRNARAVHIFLGVLIKNAEDIAQAFLLHALHSTSKSIRTT